MAKYILTSEKEIGIVTNSTKGNTAQDVLKIMQRLEPERNWTKCEKVPKGKHICKYCYQIAEGTFQDLLCNDCRETFGHSLYSEL